MLKIENSEILYGLLLLIPLAILLFIGLNARRKKIKKLGNQRIINLLIPSLSLGKMRLKVSLILFVLGLLIFCLANPQLGSEVQKVERKGIDLMIALDISNSMNCEDIQPSRLSRAKQSIIQLLSKMKNDRIGLVVFAGDAFMQLPLTSDYGAAKLFINSVSTNDLSVQGTAIGKALDLCIDCFDKQKSNKRNKAILVISDGENHEDDAIRTAKNAAEENIIVCCIGMGSPEGAPIPVYAHGQLQGYKKNKNGETIITKLNEKMLDDIANSGQGYYIGANNSSARVDEVFEKLNTLDKEIFESKYISTGETKYQYILGLAFILLLLEIFIFEKKNKYINHQNLFGEKK